jgi:hypothetical protein
VNDGAANAVTYSTSNFPIGPLKHPDANTHAKIQTLRVGHEVVGFTRLTLSSAAFEVEVTSLERIADSDRCLLTTNVGSIESFDCWFPDNPPE